MLRSRLFWKLLLTITALNGLGLGALGYITAQRQSVQALTEARAELAEVADLSILALAMQPSPNDETLKSLATETAEATGFRVTLIDKSGKALADSEAMGPQELQSLGSLSQKPDVLAARAEGEGFDQRGDRPNANSTLYAAKRVDGEGRVDVVRVSRSLGLLEDRLASQRGYYLLLGLAIGVPVAIAAALFARHVAKPVLSLSQAADAICRGDYHKRAYVPNNDELGVLAQSFNRMSQELGSQLVELREGGQRQATVLGGMIEGVIAVDGDERVLFANTAAGKLFGFIPPQVEGRPLLEVVRHHTLHQAVATGLSVGRPQRLEIEWEGPERLILLLQVTPLPGDPCPGVVVVMHDTTELRRLETLRQDFVANVSHELKTPLSSIKAYTETLLAGAVDDKEHNLKFLQRIEEQADRLNNLIQDLLALARIESAQQPFEMAQIAIGDVVAACLDDYRTMAEAKQISLVSETHDGDLHVTADPEGLRVILNNLIDNAIKYTPVGGRVSVRWERGEQGWAQLDVADNGIGIPSDAQPRVFERFFRVDRARSRELGGTGLGLAIVKHLAQAFGGSVSVASQVGEGTTFSVQLPTP